MDIEKMKLTLKQSRILQKIPAEAMELIESFITGELIFGDDPQTNHNKIMQKKGQKKLLADIRKIRDSERINYNLVKELNE